MLIDEFERLLDPAAQAGFPFPDFFNGLRALIEQNWLALVVASRRPLAEYFGDPARPAGMTSTFPSYLTPFTLAPLDAAAADALLLQASDRRLTLDEAATARRWAVGRGSAPRCCSMGSGAWARPRPCCSCRGGWAAR